MALDDLLDRARDLRRGCDEAVAELAALVRALDGLEGVGLLDDPQRRELSRLRERPRTRASTRRRRPGSAGRARGAPPPPAPRPPRPPPASAKRTGKPG